MGNVNTRCVRLLPHSCTTCCNNCSETRRVIGRCRAAKHPSRGKRRSDVIHQRHHGQRSSRMNQGRVVRRRADAIAEYDTVQSMPFYSARAAAHADAPSLPRFHHRRGGQLSDKLSSDRLYEGGLCIRSEHSEAGGYGTVMDCSEDIALKVYTRVPVNEGSVGSSVRCNNASYR